MINNPSIIVRWVNDFKKQGIKGLKSKKRRRPSKCQSQQINQKISK